MFARGPGGVSQEFKQHPGPSIHGWGQVKYGENAVVKKEKDVVGLSKKPKLEYEN